MWLSAAISPTATSATALSILRLSHSLFYQLFVLSTHRDANKACLFDVIGYPNKPGSSLTLDFRTQPQKRGVATARRYNSHAQDLISSKI
jgi:hypothetical protein